MAMGRALPHGVVFVSRRGATIRGSLGGSFFSSSISRSSAGAMSCSQLPLRAFHSTLFLRSGYEEKDHRGIPTTITTRKATEQGNSSSSDGGGGGGGGDGGGRSSSGGGGIFGSLPTHTALSRIGRGMLVAVPLVGAGFSAVLARRDYRRVHHELKLARVRRAMAEREYHREMSSGETGAGKKDDLGDRPPRVLESSTASCFGLALAADSGIVAAHLVAAYGLYQGWAPDAVFNAEIVSLVGALVSTGGGLRGEYLTATREDAQMSHRGRVERVVPQSIRGGISSEGGSGGVGGNTRE